MTKTKARKRQILKPFTGGSFMKFKIAYVNRDQTFIVFTGSQVIEKDLSEDAATRLAQFLNTQEYLNTDPKARAVRAQPLPSFDFDRIYAMYPRLGAGKKQGLEKLKKKITTLDKYELLEQAVLNYAKLCESVEDKYIKMFSTFVNCWEDYIPEEATVSSAPAQMSLDEITEMMSQ